LESTPARSGQSKPTAAAFSVIRSDRTSAGSPAGTPPIALRGALHNDPIEGAALADLNDALDWLLGKSSLEKP